MSSFEAIIYWTALVIYTAATVSFLYAVSFRKPKAVTAAVWLTLAGFVFNTISVIWRIKETGHIPVKGNFENTLIGAWFIVLSTLIVAFRSPKFRMVGLGAVPLALLLLGFGATQPSGVEPLSPPYQSVWLVIHIAFAWISYGAYSVACGAGICFLIQDKAEKTGEESRLAEILPPSGWLDEYIFKLVLLGFITSAMMIVAGSFWANSLWGTYWGWDPVETWSLISWLTYGLYIHLRVTMKWRGQRTAWLAIIAIIFVMVSFWGVNFIESSFHIFEKL